MKLDRETKERLLRGTRYYQSDTIPGKVPHGRIVCHKAKAPVAHVQHAPEHRKNAPRLALPSGNTHIRNIEGTWRSRYYRPDNERNDAMTTSKPAWIVPAG